MVSVPGSSVPESEVTQRIGERRFYFWLASVCALIIFAGFTPTYWLQLPAGTFDGPRLLHIHGIVFSLWPLFLLGQTYLASTGRVAAHRSWGLFGISLATAMFLLGVAAGTQTVALAIGTPTEESFRVVSVLAFSSMGLFAGFVTAAILNIKRPETHKRLMLLATVSILQAAVARIFFTIFAGYGPGYRPGRAFELGFGTPSPSAATAAGLLIDLVIVAMIVHDIRVRGRIHRATAIGGLIILSVQFLRFPLTTTPAWRTFIDFMVAFTS
jgi:hypothetical protein